MKGSDLTSLASRHLGEKYILGSLAPKSNANFKGPWDCAEFVSYIVYQTIKRLYGCANNQTQHPETADAGTIYWARDCDNNTVKMIDITTARNTPGAILLREAGDGMDGHIVFSLGNGHTVEAHGHVDGVVNNVVDGRRWTHGILIPDIDYETNGAVAYNAPHSAVYHVTTPLMQGMPVIDIQQALKAYGINIKVDGIYGNSTADAVREFQADQGLIHDGEAGPQTLKALGLNI